MTRLFYFVPLGLALALGGCASAIQRAARDGQADQIRAIIESKRPKEKYVRRALCLAAGNGHAAAVGSAEAIKVLLDAKADANARNVDGVTALMAAVLAARLEAVSALLGAGADPNLKAKNGGTALSLAEAAGQKEIAAMLRKAGTKE